jgi:hypothetical protein
MSVATPTDTAHDGAHQERFVRYLLASIHGAPDRPEEPREHRLSEPIVVPLPRRAVLDAADW